MIIIILNQEIGRGALKRLVSKKNCIYILVPLDEHKKKLKLAFQNAILILLNLKSIFFLISNTLYAFSSI